jgi:hypothetical protein
MTGPQVGRVHEERALQSCLQSRFRLTGAVSLIEVRCSVPLHHGLIGTRSLLTSGASAPAFTSLGLELAVGAGWFILALLSFRTFADK